MLRQDLTIVGACMVVFAVAPGAWAQEAAGPPLPIAEVSGGYAYMRDTTSEENFPAGWYSSAAANLNQWLGLAGVETREPLR
jgi:hypothetical protein